MSPHGYQPHVDENIVYLNQVFTVHLSLKEGSQSLVRMSVNKCGPQVSLAGFCSRDYQTCRIGKSCKC